MRNLRPPFQDSGLNSPFQNQTNQSNQKPNRPMESKSEKGKEQQPKRTEDTQKEPELKLVYMEEIHKTSQRHKLRPQDYKINPKVIPRPNNNDEIYLNSEKNIIYETTIGTVPPYSTSYYLAKETQNSSPRFIRSTMNFFPNNQTLLTSSCLSLGLICQPFCELSEHESPVPLVDAVNGILRCKKCMAYVNSKFKMTYSNMRKQIAICNLCASENEFDSTKTEMKGDYFTSDTSMIPELTYPTVDFALSNKSFNSEKKFLPHYIFMIDISSSSYEMNLPNYILNSIQSNLDYFNNANQSYVAFALYEYKAIYFFHCQNEVISLSIMSDINDPFCPIAMNKLYLNVIKDRSLIEKLLEALNIFIDEKVKVNKSQNKSTSMPSGAAIKSGICSLMDNGGRVMLFTSSPCSHGYGGCQPRDILNKDKEEKISDIVPQHELFTKLSETALEGRVVIDQFLFFNKQYDLATLSIISNLTGGHVKFYQHSKEGTIVNSTFDKLHYDITRIVSRPNYYDFKTMIRFSEGLDCFEILGPFAKKSGEAFVLSSCDPDYTFAYYLRLNDSFKPEQKLNIQLACLYTDNYNQKYLRMFNLAYETTDEVAKLFNSADVHAEAKLIIMKEISLLWRTDVKSVRKNLEDRIINSFKFYRVKEKSSTSPGQLILPVGLRYLPLFLNSFIKKGMLTKGALPVNVYVDYMHKFMRDPLPNVIKMLYPKFYRIDDILSTKYRQDKTEGTGTGIGTTTNIENIGLVNERYNMTQKPLLLHLSKDNIDFDCAYITDDGSFISLFVFEEIDSEFYQSLFGYSTWTESKEIGITSLNEEIESNNDLNTRLVNIVNQLRKENGGVYQPLRIFFLNEKTYNHPSLMNLLIEDKVNDEVNYSDYLCMIHSKISNRIYN